MARFLIYFALSLVHITVRIPAVTSTGLIPSRCNKGEFYDHGTDNCEPCRDICQYAKITRTEEECQRLCPDYGKASNCKADEYYDDVVSSCSSCREICHNHQSTASTDSCYKHCKDYMDKISQAPSHSKIDTFSVSSNQKVPAGDSNPTSLALSPGWIVAIASFAVSGVLVLAVVYLVVKVCRQPRQAKYQSIQITSKPAIKSLPVEESGRDHSSEQEFALPFVSVSPQTALTELTMERSNGV